MLSLLLFSSAPFGLVAHLHFAIPVAHKVQLLGLIVLRDPTPWINFVEGSNPVCRTLPFSRFRQFLRGCVIVLLAELVRSHGKNMRPRLLMALVDGFDLEFALRARKCRADSVTCVSTWIFVRTSLFALPSGPANGLARMEFRTSSKLCWRVCRSRESLSGSCWDADPSNEPLKKTWHPGRSQTDLTEWNAHRSRLYLPASLL